MPLFACSSFWDILFNLRVSGSHYKYPGDLGCLMLPEGFRSTSFKQSITIFNTAFNILITVCRLDVDWQSSLFQNIRFLNASFPNAATTKLIIFRCSFAVVYGMSPRSLTFYLEIPASGSGRNGLGSRVFCFSVPVTWLSVGW